MIEALNHVAIVVPNLDTAASFYRNSLGAAVSERQTLPEHGVTVVFVELENTKIELLEPLGQDSPVSKFLERNPSGGIHHICLEVTDIGAAAKSVTSSGLRILGDGEPKIGAHGKPVLFLHPKDSLGVLLELEEA